MYGFRTFHAIFAPCAVSLASEPLFLPFQAIAKRVLDDEEYFANGILTKEIAADFLELWADAGIQKTYHRQNEFQLTDSAA